jgi:hypothetical protein
MDREGCYFSELYPKIQEWTTDDEDIVKLKKIKKNDKKKLKRIIKK